MTEHVMSREVLAVVQECVPEGTSLNTRYTGRGMWHADTCVALSTRDVTGLVRFMINLVVALQDVPASLAERLAEVIDQLDHGITRQDQLGRGLVYYWPQLCVGVE